ncbi:MAG: hypothetical protein NVSMB16_14820 [Acidimicrobiales bacterium]
MGTPRRTVREIVLTPLLPLPRQPDGLAWPTRDWPTGPSTAALDAVVVRLGKTDAANYPLLRAWIGRVLDALSG